MQKELEDKDIDLHIDRETLLQEYIPRAEFEQRLKADMVAILTELKSEMNPIKECEQQIYGKENWNFVRKCQDVIQQKIDSLKENSHDD